MKNNFVQTNNDYYFVKIACLVRVYSKKNLTYSKFSLNIYVENIPDEMKALRVAAPMSTVAGMLPPTLEWPSNVVNMVS